MHIGHGELMPQIARFVVTLLSAGVLALVDVESGPHLKSNLVIRFRSSGLE